MIEDDRPPSSWRFAAALTAAFALATLPRLLRHELWRDEAWLWLVVSENPSLRDLFAVLERSGQGYLFPLLCHWARQLFAAPVAMQLLHLAVAGAGVLVFSRYAPAGRVAKVLFVLGYFPFYEYAVLSRHYALGMLFLWLACAAARAGRELVLAAALALLCQTTVYGYILAVAVAAGWWIESLERPAQPRRPAARLAALALVLAGAVAGMMQLVPSAGTSFSPAWRLAWNGRIAQGALRTPWRAMVPLPSPVVQFWNSNLLDGWPATETVLGAASLLLAVAILWPRRSALATFLVGACGLLAFSYVKFFGSLRHQGHFWLLLVAALWLGGGLPAGSTRRSWRTMALAALALCQILAGIYASWVDWRQPFTNAGAAVAILRRAHLEDEPLLAHREPPASSVALLLGRPLYSPSRRVFTTHPDWGPEQHEMGDAELRCAARGLAAGQGRDVVLVLNHPAAAWPEVEAVGAAPGAIVASEDFWIYRLRLAALPATQAAAGCPP